MPTQKTSEQTNGLAEQAMQILLPADADRLVNQASVLAQHGLDGLRDRSQQLRERARRATDRALLQVRDEPVKALLIAAAAGAVLMAVFGLPGRSRRRPQD